MITAFRLTVKGKAPLFSYTLVYWFLLLRRPLRKGTNKLYFRTTAAIVVGHTNAFLPYFPSSAFLNSKSAFNTKVKTHTCIISQRAQQCYCRRAHCCIPSSFKQRQWQTKKTGKLSQKAVQRSFSTRFPCGLSSFQRMWFAGVVVRNWKLNEPWDIS